MAIDASKYLGGTPGTWNWYGINLPDYGFTETNASPSNPVTSNPLVNQYYGSQTSQGQVQGAQAPVGDYDSPIGPTYSGPLPTTQTQKQAPTVNNNVQSVGYDPSFENQTVSMNGVTWKSTRLPNGSLGWVQEGGGGPSQADLDAVYNPAMNTLNQQEASYRAQYDPAKTALENQYSQGIAGLNAQGTEAYSKLSAQEQKKQQDQANAYARARQLFSELTQRNQAMFGGRNSAGQFAGELLGRETAKQMGDITNQGTNATQAIETERNRVGQWVRDQTNTWNQKKTEALSSLENSFRQGLDQINAQRNTLESAKAQARLDLLNQAKQQAMQIQAADRTFQQQLALFQAQKEAQMSQGTGANLGQDVYSQNRIGPMGGLTVYSPNGGPAIYGQGSSTPGPQTTYIPVGWRRDETTGQLVRI